MLKPTMSASPIAAAAVLGVSRWMIGIPNEYAVGPLRMFLDVGLQQRDRVGQVHGGIHSRVHLHEPDVHCVARPCVCHLLLSIRPEGGIIDLPPGRVKDRT